MTGGRIQRLVAPLLNLVYPVSCPLCGNDDPQCEQHETHFCSDCREQLTSKTDSFCRWCGAALGPHLHGDSRCQHCRNDRFAFSGTVALGTYSGTLRQACLKCKEPGTAELLEALVSLLWERHEPTLRAWNIELVTCVPQHWRKRLGRSINTSAELGARLAQKLRLPFARQLLLKSRHTSDQARLTPTARRSNLKQAFRASFPALSRGRRILIVDDVLTTGSTADRCARALKADEASEIFVAVIGRGLG